MEVVVRTITTPKALSEVHRLAYREYLDQGYIKPDPSGVLQHYPHLDAIPATTVLGAYEGDELVGTNTLTLDSRRGLHVDEDWPELVGQIRQWCSDHGLNLGASWRIIVARSQRGRFSVLTSLLRETVRLGCKLRLHVTLYSFNPRHIRVYQRFLGLETLAYDVCRAVGEQPAVLMCGDSRVLQERCRSRWGLPCSGNCDTIAWPKGVGTWKGPQEPRTSAAERGD